MDDDDDDDTLLYRLIDMQTLEPHRCTTTFTPFIIIFRNGNKSKHITI